MKFQNVLYNAHLYVHKIFYNQSNICRNSCIFNYTSVHLAILLAKDIDIFREILRRSTCLLLSRIVTTLAEKSMPICRSTNQEVSFENLIYRGLLDLPKDSEQWENVIAHDRKNRAVALMTLIYYHFHGTKEYVNRN